MSLLLPSIKGAGNSGLEVSEVVFGQEYNETLIHQLVVKYMAAGRSGTKAQKNRSAVSGGGLKPFRQKGTGRARAGTTRSPIWRTGGVTFAAQPRSYEQKLNKKMYRVGLRSILSELVRQDRLSISDDIYPSAPRTKEFLSKIAGVSAKRLLILADRIDENLFLAARNIPNIAVLTPSSLDPVSLVSADKIVATSAAITQLQERLS